MLSQDSDKFFSLENSVVVVTGGGGFLAGAMAQAIAKAGARTALLDLNLSAAEKAVEKIGESAIAVQADVLNRDSLSNAGDKILAAYGRIDGLINGAGGNKTEATTSDELSFFDLPVDASRWVTDLNFMGTVLPCQVFGKEIVKQGKGAILNVSSITGLRPLTRASTYAAAKAAISNFTAWLAVHMCQNYSREVRVNAVAPGFCLTDQNRYLLIDENGELTPRSKTVLAATPQGRFGEPEDLTAAAVWLLSDASSFVTGSTITIDGGLTAYSGV